MQSLTITRPDDWHLHVRDDAGMASVIGHTAARFGRAIIMPNLKPPVTTVAQAEAYRERILAALPAGTDFTPLMTLYLTDNTAGTEIARAASNEHVHAVKLYPAGATTHSDAGVTAIEKTFAALEAMQEHGLPLLVHGEATSPEVDVFDREKVFIDRTLQTILQRFPDLRVVFEHITTADAVSFVREAGDNIAATITVHHLLMNRNAMFAGGIRPHHYCLPVLKREQHRTALVEAATSGESRFFLGTDSAPHPKHAKESACGCAGMYTAHAAIELYAEVFDAAGALDKLEGFASHYGADFYRLPRNTGTITLTRQRWQVPSEYAFGQDTVVPLRAGETISWQLA
ncbi:MAG: dihydroorotase [Granulosicoccaceae bacterium]|jgi:dihydroorotase